MRVLVATDGSPCASVAVDLAAALAWPPGSEFHVVQAVPSGVTLFGGPWPPLPPADTAEFDAGIRHEAEAVLAVARGRLTGVGRSIETSVATGRPASVVVTLAEQIDADLIVVGSRGHGTLETMLLGSVSAEVIDRAHVPVLVARKPTVERVVYAWDGSACAGRAARTLTDWHVFRACSIDVLSVADAEPPWFAELGMAGPDAVFRAYEDAGEPSRQQHEQLARDMADLLGRAGLRAKPQRRDGDPAEQIVKFASAHDADLVLVGTHGRTGLSRLLMGSVARNVLLHASCSVLIVPEQGNPEDDET